jgi:protein-disulfide isomerase
MGLDLKKFSLDLMRPSIRKQIELDAVDAKKAGVTGTPAIFVNGRKLKTRSFDAMSKLIDSELAKLQK